MPCVKFHHLCDFHDEIEEEPCLPLQPPVVGWPGSPGEAELGWRGPVWRVPRVLDAAPCLHELMAVSLSPRTGQEVLLPGPEIDFLFKT